MKKYYGRRNDLEVGEQFKHRIARLYPPYIALLIVAILLTLLRRVIPYDLLSHLFSIQNLHWMITEYHSPMQWMTAHTWTLSIEVINGLVWLILLKYCSKESFCKAMVGAIILAIGYRIVTISFIGDVYITSLCPIAHMDAFGLGSLLAVSCNKNVVKKNSLYACVLLGISGIFISIIYLARSNHLSLLDGYKLLSSSKNYLTNALTGNIYLFISLLSVGIIGSLYANSCKEKDKKDTFFETILRKIGDDSYVLYLFHWPILVVVKRVLTENWLLTFPIVLSATFFAALLFKRVLRKWRLQ